MAIPTASNESYIAANGFVTSENSRHSISNKLFNHMLFSVSEINYKYKNLLDVTNGLKARYEICCQVRQSA